MMLLKIFFLVFLSIITYCGSDTCENIISMTDFDEIQCNNDNNEYFIENLDNTCIPGCRKFQPVCEICSQFKKCAPGLNCVEGNDALCVTNPNSCMKYVHLRDIEPKWIPKCLPDGSYASKQCKGESQNGRCYCYSPEGKRIFGEEWSRKADNMTCACSLHRWNLAQAGRTDVTLHCDRVGNFEPLQCDSGSCWCAEPQTGQVVGTVVPEDMMKYLPCYKKEEVGDQYLRQCESQLIAQELLRKELSDHGTLSVDLPFIMCDYDGSYGILSLEKGRVTCIWRDKTVLGSWADAQSQTKLINCNCARDSKIYELDNKELTKECHGNGNYRALQQTIDGKYYCVDSDGFATTDSTEETLTEEYCANLSFDVTMDDCLAEETDDK